MGPKYNPQIASYWLVDITALQERVAKASGFTQNKQMDIPGKHTLYVFFGHPRIKINLHRISYLVSPGLRISFYPCKVSSETTFYNLKGKSQRPAAGRDILRREFSRPTQRQAAERFNWRSLLMSLALLSPEASNLPAVVYALKAGRVPL